MYHGVCFLCGKTGPLEEHHVFGGPNRKLSEEDGLKVGLCGDSCHRNGRYAAHACRETREALRQFWQIKYMMRTKCSVRDFIQRYGRNYLEFDYYDDERKYPMNITAQSGRLVRDPELRYTDDSKAVCSFCIAVNRPGTKDKADFIDCVAWEKKAEFISKYFHRGSRIEVSGILTTRTYEAKDGGKRKATEIWVDQAFFGDSKRDDADNNVGNMAGGYSAGQSAAAPATGAPSDFAVMENDDAQLPF